jgi:phospholipase/lecithinase/hemolysin
MRSTGAFQRLRNTLSAAVLLLSLVLPLSASAYEFILSFGDSLTDNGSADGYGIQRYSNGPVWAEYLAVSLNDPLLDKAYGGATTGMVNPAAHVSYLGMQWQVNTYLGGTGGTVSSDALVTLWGGAMISSRAGITRPQPATSRLKPSC